MIQTHVSNETLISLLKEFEEFYSSWGIDAIAWCKSFQLHKYYEGPWDNEVSWYALYIKTTGWFHRDKTRRILRFREVNKGIWYAEFRESDLVLLPEALKSMHDDILAYNVAREDKQQIDDEFIKAVLELE